MPAEIVNERICIDACPVGAIRVEEQNGSKKKPHRWAVVDDALCLGCGVCHGACKPGGVTMKPRAQRVLTPETMFDRVAAMAVERGNLQDLVFDNQAHLSHRAMAAMLGAILKLPPVKRALASEQLRSRYLDALSQRY